MTFLTDADCTRLMAVPAEMFRVAAGESLQHHGRFTPRGVSDPVLLSDRSSLVEGIV